MNKFYKKFLVVLAFWFIYFKSNAQNTPIQTNDTLDNYFKSEVRWVASSQLLGRTQFAFERAISKHSTFTINIGGYSSFGIDIKGISSSNFELNPLESKGGFNLIFEYRYYLPKTKNSLDGFYLGMYGAFSKNTFFTNGWYIDSNNMQNDLILDSELQTYSLGIQVGYKLRVYKNLAIDFIIAGPGYSKHSIDFYFNSNINMENINLIRQTIDDRYNFLSEKLPKLNSNDNFKSFSLDFSLPSFRYGIGIGYSF